MEVITKEQKTNITNWVIQRDNLLLEIQNLKETSNNLHKTNKELANSKTDMENKMNEIKGRIEELKNKEEEIPTTISKEIVFLESKKVGLESEIPLLKKIINVLTTQKDTLESDIEKNLNTFNIVKGETLLLGKVVDKVTKISKENSDNIDLLVSNLSKSLEEIIEVNRKNVRETSIVIDKVPKMIMECQKHGLIKNKI